ncbi:uncharacterized protein LOC127252169 [Andrographis paniculata]|uniref:uncharacterized protein LOC127252169 n=1 Tax=Andrographis paniculata TaxID=175694 RepID=UPI0021E8982C|nr:uncharacterized protein LOC127252169 [Andrographis paniculata]XP_051132192.1 uncharacterized protein LOC127252169 [Andrographis paniculata]XP_051132193.1 uncharacterized protein LOC127252169 [Andrographis paniculata]
MECNKDEAIRARSIAQRKMEENEFEAARKFVLKAQNLYPGLDSIGQLLSICDVQCSAKIRLGSEKDWYGVLQVEKLADESKIKKQYRRLALSLHPDKNRFPGAEGAFKLICEANSMLSDPSKKSIYDNRIRFLVKSGSVNSASQRTNSAQNNVSDGFRNQNQNQAAAQPASSVKQEIFWTCCPYCGIKYQYLREYIRRSLRCQKCLRIFIGYEAGVKCASMDPNLGQSGASSEKVASNMSNAKTCIQNDEGPSASHLGSGGTTNQKTVKATPGNRTGGGSEGTQASNSHKVNVDMKTKETDNAKSCRAKQGGASSSDAIKKEKADVKNKRKRSREVVEESSESSDSLSESEVYAPMKHKFCDGAIKTRSKSSQAQSPRRSSRKKQQVAYNEMDEDGLANLMTAQASQKSQGKAQADACKKHDIQNSSSNDAELAKSKQMGNVHSKESSQKRDADCVKECKANEEPNVKSETAAHTLEANTDFDKDSSPRNDMDAVSYCPDPEFSDFDKVRDEKHFSANQFWACYDTLDGMPRFYAKVKKVCKNPFCLTITWLEAVPIHKAFVDWVVNELPASCGTFKFGETESTSARLSFSHQVRCEKGLRKGSYVIYPREGEVWAMFKDWNINWSSDPDNHKEEFKYEVVEVISNFVEGEGIKVCYLDKVDGFVSLFDRGGQSEDNSVVIGPDELYKFSHPIPCSKMTGTEREGVPIGSFELDPAALPMKPEDLFYLSKVKVEQINASSGPNLAMKNGKSLHSAGKHTPKKIVDAKEV